MNATHINIHNVSQAYSQLLLRLHVTQTALKERNWESRIMKLDNTRINSDNIIDIHIRNNVRLV